MKISSKAWKNYIKRLAKINTSAAADVVKYMVDHDVSTYEGTKALIDYAHAVSTKYGEAAAELSCQMYDAIATASKVTVPAAEPAATATYGEIAKSIYGTMASTKNPDAIGAAVGRSVKLASVDTLQKNALRDGAEWAWIPAGDTCPYCLMLASNGWRKASKKAIKNGHAEHIHNNCDCTYCVRFDHETTVEGYDPDALYDQYMNAGDTSNERLNALRRQHYAANRDNIRAQQNAAYARREIAKHVANTGENDIIALGTDGDSVKRIPHAFERAKIIREAISAEMPVYAHDLRAAYRMVQQEEDLYDVAIHGAPEFVEYENKYRFGAETLAYIISGRRDYRGHDIRLIACSAGRRNAKGYCVAQELANILNVTVYAADDTVNIGIDGKLTVGRDKISFDEARIVFTPQKR